MIQLKDWEGSIHLRRQSLIALYILLSAGFVLSVYNGCEPSGKLSVAAGDNASGSAGSLNFLVQPSSTNIAGQPFSQSPQVQLLNSQNSISSSVQLRAYTDSSCTNLATGQLTFQYQVTGPKTLAFNSVTYSKAEKIFLLVSGSNSTSACSQEVSVGPGAAAKLRFSSQPASTGFPAMALSVQPKVEILDSFDNKTASNASVSLSLASDANCATLLSGVLGVANNSVASTNGTAAFNGAAISTSGTYYLKATSTGLSDACSTSIAVSGSFLTNIAAASGLQDTNLSEQGWLSISDFDNDGRVDVLMAGANAGSHKLFRNNGNNSFQSFANVGASVRVGSFGDCNNDGYRDILLSSNSLGLLQLFKNNLGGGFLDSSAGAALNNANSEGAAWLDYNKDGLLDVFHPDGATGAMTMSKNIGDCRFVADTANAGLPVIAGYNNDVVYASDFDADGDSDLFVGVSQNITPTVLLLFRNNGNSTFTNISTAAGLGTAVSLGLKAGHSTGDYDNDGDLDLFVGGIGASSRLYRNNGNATFTDVSAAAGFGGVTTNVHGVSFGDLDNDGYLDIYAVNSNSRDFIYHNNGNGTFTEVGNSVGAANVKTADLTSGVAIADTDNDGDLDVIVNNSQATPTVFYRNNQTSQNFLRVRVAGKVAGGAPRDGTGTLIRLYNSAGTVLLATREVQGGGSYGQNEPTVHFGLANSWGGSSGPYVVKAQFPNGIEKVVSGIIPATLPPLAVGISQLPHTVQISE